MRENLYYAVVSGRSEFFGPHRALFIGGLGILILLWLLWRSRSRS